MRLKLVYTITWFLAACSLIYELLIAQSVSLLSANAAVRYSVTIGLYLGAMGVGAFFCPRISGKSKPWDVLFKVEILLSAAGALSVIIVNWAHVIFSYTVLVDLPGWGAVIFFLIAAAVAVAVGFLTGLELPLLIRIGNELSGRRVTNRVLGADYFGSLTAGVVFPLLLLPHLDLIDIGFITAFANTIAGFFILVFFVRPQRAKIPAAVTVILGAFLIIGNACSGSIQQYFLKRYYYYNEYYNRLKNFDFLSYMTANMDFPPVERISSPYQKIDIVKEVSYGDPFTPFLIDAYSTKYIDDPHFPRKSALFLNGDYQFWLDFEEIYHEYFAHVPVILNGAVPVDILVLGAGDGLLVRELLKYSQVRHITLVELDEKMVELAGAHPFFSYASRNSLRDPRVKVVIADAYHYVRMSKESYDAVYIDFPDPNDYNLSKLYSREFYRHVGRCLKSGGYIVFDAPGIAVSSRSPGEAGDGLENGYEELQAFERWEILHDTLEAAGFQAITPYFSNLETDNEQARATLDGLLMNAA